MIECFCVECSWTGAWSSMCPECFGPVLLIENLEERAGLIEFSEPEENELMTTARAEYLAVASQMKNLKLSAVNKSTVMPILHRWKNLTEPEMRNAA